MRKIVRWVNSPFISGPVVGSLQNSIRRQVPHLGVAIVQVLLHAQIGFLGLIFPVLHVLKLHQRLLDWSISMDTRPWLALLFTSVELYFFL